MPGVDEAFGPIRPAIAPELAERLLQQLGFAEPAIDVEEFPQSLSPVVVEIVPA